MTRFNPRAMVLTTQRQRNRQRQWTREGRECWYLCPGCDRVAPSDFLLGSGLPNARAGLTEHQLALRIGHVAGRAAEVLADVHAALHRRPLLDRVEPAAHVRVCIHRLLETLVRHDPGPRSNVRD